MLHGSCGSHVRRDGKRSCTPTAVATTVVFLSGCSSVRALTWHSEYCEMVRSLVANATACCHPAATHTHITCVGSGPRVLQLQAPVPLPPPPQVFVAGCQVVAHMLAVPGTKHSSETPWAKNIGTCRDQSPKAGAGNRIVGTSGSGGPCLDRSSGLTGSSTLALRPTARCCCRLPSCSPRRQCPR